MRFKSPKSTHLVFPSSPVSILFHCGFPLLVYTGGDIGHLSRAYCMSFVKAQRDYGNAVCVDLGDSHTVVCISISLNIVHFKFTFIKCNLHSNEICF